jgi:hypothetical protein
MTALLIGYARVSTDVQDLTAQRDGLLVGDCRTAADSPWRLTACRPCR